MTEGQQWLERARREPDPNRADHLAALAVQAAPQSPDAYVLRGQIAVHRGDVLAAAHHLRVAFARGARDTFTRDVLGLCLSAAGQPELAARMRVSPTTPPALASTEARALQATEAVRAVLARALPPAEVPGWLPNESPPLAVDGGTETAAGQSAERAPEVPPAGSGVARAGAGASTPASGRASAGPSAASAGPVHASAGPLQASAGPGPASAGPEQASAGPASPASAPVSPGGDADGAAGASIDMAGAEGGSASVERTPITNAPEAAVRKLPGRSGVSVVRTAVPAEQTAVPPRREEGVRVVRGPTPGAPAGVGAAPANTPAASEPGVVLALSLPAAPAPAENVRSVSPAPRTDVPGDAAPRPMQLPTASTAPAPVRPLRIHRIATVQPDWLDATPQYEAAVVPVAADWLEDTAVPGAPTTSTGGFEGGGIELALDPGELSAPVRSPVTGRMVATDDLKRQRAGAMMPALDVPVGLLDARDAFNGLLDLALLRAAVDLPGPVLTRPQHPPRQLTRAVAAGLTDSELLLRDRINPQVGLQRLGLSTFDRIEVLADGAQLSCSWSDGRALHLDLRSLRQRAPVVAASFVRALLDSAETASLGRS